MKRIHYWLIATVGVILVALAALAASYLLRNHSPIPSSIQSQLSFTPFVAGKEGDVIGTDSYKFDAKNDLLSYVIHLESGTFLTVSEQSTPQQFIDIPDGYVKLTDGLNRYGVFVNPLGTVYLTRPKGQSAGQTAVLNASGVLMFVRSSKDLTDDQWRRVFNQFSLEPTP